MQPGSSPGVVTCSIGLRFPTKDLDQAVQLLVSAVGRTEAALGCKGCTVARDAAEDGLVHYHETWETKAAFQRHLRSEEFKRVLMAMDMCSEEPQVTVGNLTGRNGIAYLEKLRGEDRIPPKESELP